MDCFEEDRVTNLSQPSDSDGGIASQNVISPGTSSIIDGGGCGGNESLLGQLNSLEGSQSRLDGCVLEESDTVTSNTIGGCLLGGLDLDMLLNSNACGNSNNNSSITPSLSDMLEGGGGTIKPLTCTKHSKEIIKFYCKTCDIPACIECIKFEHPKGLMHDHELLSDAAPKYFEHLNRLVDDSRVKVSELSQSLKNFEHVTQRLQMQYNKAQNEILNTYQFYSNAIEEVKQGSLKELQDIYNSRMVTLTLLTAKVEESIRKVQQIDQFMERVRKFSSPAELLLFKNAIESKLQPILVLSSEMNVPNPELEFVSNYQAIQENVRKTYGYLRSSEMTTKEPSISQPSLMNNMNDGGLLSHSDHSQAAQGGGGSGPSPSSLSSLASGPNGEGSVGGLILNTNGIQNSNIQVGSSISSNSIDPRSSSSLADSIINFNHEKWSIGGGTDLPGSPMFPNGSGTTLLDSFNALPDPIIDPSIKPMPSTQLTMPIKSQNNRQKTISNDGSADNLLNTDVKPILGKETQMFKGPANASLYIIYPFPSSQADNNSNKKGGQMEPGNSSLSNLNRSNVGHGSSRPKKKKSSLPDQNDMQPASDPALQSQGQVMGKRPPKLKCSFCDRAFNKNFDLQQHIRCHTGEKPFQCVVCGRAFAQKSNVKKHMQTHKVWPDGLAHTMPGENGDSLEPTVIESKDEATKEVAQEGSSQSAQADSSYACPYCAYIGKSYFELKSHMKSHKREKVYKCIQGSCGKTFADLEPFLNHIDAHKNEMTYRCHQCSKAFESLLELGQHQYSHSLYPTQSQRPTQKYYRCSKCLNKYTTPTALEHHIATSSHHYPCPQCNKVFPCERYLRRHLLTHGTGLHVCTFCNKTFKTANYLKVHLVIHTGDKPYSCTQCNAAFNRRDKLKRHKLVHDPIKRFKCPYKAHTGCPKEFNRPDKLKAHILTHNGIKPHTCPHCGRQFSRRAHVREHVKQHHGSIKSMSSGLGTVTSVTMAGTVTLSSSNLPSSSKDVQTPPCKLNEGFIMLHECHRCGEMFASEMDKKEHTCASTAVSVKARPKNTSKIITVPNIRSGAQSTGMLGSRSFKTASNAVTLPKGAQRSTGFVQQRATSSFQNNVNPPQQVSSVSHQLGSQQHVNVPQFRPIEGVQKIQNEESRPSPQSSSTAFSKTQGLFSSASPQQQRSSPKMTSSNLQMKDALKNVAQVLSEPSISDAPNNELSSLQSTVGMGGSEIIHIGAGNESIPLDLLTSQIANGNLGNIICEIDGVHYSIGPIDGDSNDATNDSDVIPLPTPSSTA